MFVLLRFCSNFAMLLDILNFNKYINTMNKNIFRNITCCLIMCLTFGNTIFATSICMNNHSRTISLSDYGIKPGNSKSLGYKLFKAIEKINSDRKDDENIVLELIPGTYHFYPSEKMQREYYISNHDQDNPKFVGIPIENMNNITLDGNGAQLVFHGVMLPLSVVNSQNCCVKNLSIDFENPHIFQIEVVENNGSEGLAFRPANWVKYRITKDSIFEAYGEGWTARPSSGIAFEKDTRHIVYNTSDLFYSTKGIYELKDYYKNHNSHKKEQNSYDQNISAKVDNGNECKKTENCDRCDGCDGFYSKKVFYAPNWKDEKKALVPGTVVAMRTWDRPTPGVFVSNSKDVTFNNVKVHYARGMGLLAQVTENITLDGFSVCLKGDDDKRYFTSQADATHFSGCKGKITSVNGLYEGMMDDAINVHGTYLKVVKRIDDNTLVGRYMHGQSWGFDWGFAGDEVQFISSRTMELLDGTNKIKSITPYDKDIVWGAKEFKIVFENPVDKIVSEDGDFGIENLTWTPEVYFAGNVIRNNRARGSLFSTPKKTVVENNVFDHTSGTAILLCGDCNGWFETGACRDVVIRNNKFINSLTSMFQFTNAVISIYPEIPDLKNQIKYFHGGKKGAIQIVDNVFEIFDAPVLYAKSVDGLVFKDNIIKVNNEYKPFHWNKSRFLLERVNNAEIE